MVVIRKNVEPLAENLPDEQASPRLEHAKVSRSVRIAVRIVANRLVAELRLLIERKAEIGAGEFPCILDLDPPLVIVEHQVACRCVARLTVAGRATSFEDWLDVVELLVLERAFLVREARFSFG